MTLQFLYADGSWNSKGVEVTDSEWSWSDFAPVQSIPPCGNTFVSRFWASSGTSSVKAGKMDDVAKRLRMLWDPSITRHSFVSNLRGLGLSCEDAATESRHLVVISRIPIVKGAGFEPNNHPSGESTPSEADIHITRDLIRAGQLLKIEVLDRNCWRTGTHFPQDARIFLLARDNAEGSAVSQNTEESPFLISQLGIIRFRAPFACGVTHASMGKGTRPQNSHRVVA